MTVRRQRAGRPPARTPSPGRRRVTASRDRNDRRILALVVAGVAIAGVVALLWVAFGRPGAAAPIAWARLDTADVHAITFAPGDPEHLFFGHHDGLLESRDGGRSWLPGSLSGADAMNIRSTGGRRMQIAGHEVYLESTDGGATWQPVPNDLPGLDLHAFATDPADPEHAWTFAAGFGLFETTDAGRTWVLRQPDNWGYLTAYRSTDRTMLVAVGPEGLVSSGDGGASWEPLTYPGAPLTGGLAAAADGSALYAATTVGLRRSTDGGQTWTDTGFAGVALAVAISPDDAQILALVDERTRFYRSSDGGATWPSPPPGAVPGD